jgi:hypothetical protein
MVDKRKILIVIPALIFILACQLISNPIQGAKDTVGTVAAYATEGGEIRTEVSDFVTNLPPIGTAIPGIPEGMFDPKSPPVSEWKGIPIMPQAIAGDESEGVYVFRIAATSDDIQEYYKTNLPNLGWESSFSMPVAGSAILIYTQGDQVLTVTIMPSDGSDMLVMLTLA